jgi:hypothetical protein
MCSSGLDEYAPQPNLQAANGRCWPPGVGILSFSKQQYLCHLSMHSRVEGVRLQLLALCHDLQLGDQKATGGKQWVFGTGTWTYRSKGHVETSGSSI